MEVRIYFECLEQAEHYIRPIIQRGLRRQNIPIKLVRRPREISCAEANSIRAIYSITTPDFLITLVSENQEIPLIIGELSEAVITEDHELQRAIGAVAAVMSGAIYLKITSNKQSEREHGGITDFNPLTVAKILKEKCDGFEGFIIGTWPCVRNNPTILLRDKKNLSCPPFGSIPIAEQTLLCTGKIIAERGAKIKSSSQFRRLLLRELSSDHGYAELCEQINKAKGLQDQQNEWVRRASRRRPRICISADEISIKLNRFSHAADPDRGIITFISLVSPEKRIKARYLVKHNCCNNAKSLLEKFKTQATEEKLDQNLISALISASNCGNNVYNATSSIKKNIREIATNKVVDCILLFCDGIILHDRNDTVQVEINWDRKALFDVENTSLLNSLVIKRGFKVLGRPLKLTEVEDWDINEEEVTYIVVHRVLQPNDFKLISVSYPGAQGDAALLPEREKGRRQSRMYLDVVAWLPKYHKNSDIALEESKGVFRKRQIEEVLDRLNEIRENDSKKKALKEMISRLGENETPDKIFIGVAFGQIHNVTTWKPIKVDFIVRIADRKKWQAAHFGNALDYALRKKEGETDLPKIFKISSEDIN